MKFATLLVGAAVAFETEQDVEDRLAEIIQRNQLLSQKADLTKQLDQLNTMMGSTATTSTTASTSTTPASTSTTTTPAATTTTTTKTKSSGCSTGCIVGGVVGGVVLIGVGVWFWKKRQAGGEDHEGGEDDQYSKFVAQELSA